MRGDNSIIMYAMKAEEIIKKILMKYFNFIKENGLDKGYDFLAEFNKKKYAIEVKAPREKYYPIKNLEFTVDKLKKNRFIDETIEPVVVILGIIDNKKLINKNENIITENNWGFLYNGIRVITLKEILLFLRQHNDENLETEIISSLEFSIDDIYETKEMVSNLKDSKKNIEKSEELIKKLEGIGPGRENFLDYEEICIEILKYLFLDDLALWKSQERTDEDLYRYDMICKIKNGINKEFWNMIENYFKTKYIIFEFKNYNKEISQKEIVITEKYLYKQALRSIAIIISRKGLNENAQKIKRGILRENGKLIIDLNDEDLKKMVNLVFRGDSATDYLSEKLDEILIKLDK